jgi:hypothetical protein
LKPAKPNVQRHQGTEVVTLLLTAGDSEQVVIQASWYPTPHAAEVGTLSPMVERGQDASMPCDRFGAL